MPLNLGFLSESLGVSFWKELISVGVLTVLKPTWSLFTYAVNLALLNLEAIIS